MMKLSEMIFILMIATHTIDAAFLRCYNGSISNFTELNLTDSPNFIDTLILTDRELVIVTHGYETEINANIEGIIQSYMRTYGNNKSYCATNWAKEAKAYAGNIIDPVKGNLGVQIIGVDYPVVSAIAFEVAHLLGEALVEMAARGLNVTNVTLIGHSEGAHLSGNAARTVAAAEGTKIGQVIGLDPAKRPVEPALNKDCADFVYNIHTNPRGVGAVTPDGHVDFWLNYECEVQPGCQLKTVPLTYPSLCSHIRALLILADAIRNPQSLPCIGAPDFQTWIEGSTPSPNNTNTNFIGPKVDRSKTGSFFACTNAASVYGKGAEGMDQAQCTCPST